MVFIVMSWAWCSVVSDESELSPGKMGFTHWLMAPYIKRFSLFFFFLFQSEPEGFSHFHLYVCAAFLVRWRREILEERDFQVSKHCSQEPELGFLLGERFIKF